MSLDQFEHIYYTLLSTIDGSAHLTIDTKLVYENPLFVGQGTPSSFELVN